MSHKYGYGFDDGPRFNSKHVKYFIFCIFIIIMIMIFTSCGKTEKPFIIFSKGSFDVKENICIYYYVDKNGVDHYFTERINKYNVGDTIK